MLSPNNSSRHGLTSPQLAFVGVTSLSRVSMHSVGKRTIIDLARVVSPSARFDLELMERIRTRLGGPRVLLSQCHNTIIVLMWVSYNFTIELQPYWFFFIKLVLYALTYWQSMRWKHQVWGLATTCVDITLHGIGPVINKDDIKRSAHKFVLQARYPQPPLYIKRTSLHLRDLAKCQGTYHTNVIFAICITRSV